MGDVDSQHELPPVPWVRERDVDLLLAELFATEPAFTAWLLHHELRRPVEVPVGEPEKVHAVVNYSRPDSSAAAAGETDVLVTARFGDDLLLLSIENKVWAAPQRNQGQRHRDFVQESDVRWGLAVLIGPNAWIKNHPAEANAYHLAVTLEDIAAWCTAQTFTFRAAVFEQACRPPVFGYAEDLQDWHAQVNRLLSDELGLTLAPQQFVRTSNLGQAKPNRWAQVDVGALARPAGAQQPQLFLKPASANHGSRAVIELPKAPVNVVHAAKIGAAAHGLSVRVTAPGTLMVERHEPAAGDWTLSQPFEEQMPHLLAVGRAADHLRIWWNTLVQNQA
jgi:hypothetical protein